MNRALVALGATASVTAGTIFYAHYEQTATYNRMHAGVLRDIALEEAELQLKRETAARVDKSTADVGTDHVSAALTAAPTAANDTTRDALQQPSPRSGAALAHALPLTAGMHVGAGSRAGPGGSSVGASPEMVCEGDVCRLAVRRQTPVIPLR